MYPNIIKLAEAICFDNNVAVASADDFVKTVAGNFLPGEMEQAEAWLATLTVDELNTYACGDQEEMEPLQLRASQSTNEIADELFMLIGENV